MGTTAEATPPPSVAGLVESHSALAWKIALKWKRLNSHVCREDLHAEVVAALVRAATLFDPGRGFKFITYAYPAAERAAMSFCRAETQRGFHVPASHPVYKPGATRAISPGADLPGRPPEAAPDYPGDFWERVTAGLTRGEWALVLGVYRDGLTRAAVAKGLGLCKERGRQLLLAAVVKLRKRADVRKLMEDAA